jgi:transcriptional regulator with XRE-family HTH domain
MTERPPAPPEGALIKAARAVSGFSQREAARRAGISESRWRQIVAGFQSVGGKKVAFRSPDETVARMASVVGVTPEQLEAVGRAEAAAALRDIEAGKQDAESATLAVGSEARVDERWHMLEALLRQAPIGLSPSESSSLRSRISVYFEQSPEWQPSDDAPASEERQPRR